MTGFDIFVGAILAASAILGFLRGATRELVTAAALIGGVLGAIFGLRLSAPLAERIIHTAWLAHVAALLAVFITIYLVIRLTGGRLTRSVRETALSGPDRLAGLMLGLVRGAIAIAVLVIAIEAATPPERLPGWFTHAKVHPFAVATASALRAAAPKGVALVHRVAPSVTDALEVDNADGPRDTRADTAPRRPAAIGYTERQRGALDELVEKTR